MSLEAIMDETGMGSVRMGDEPGVLDVGGGGGNTEGFDIMQNMKLALTVGSSVAKLTSNGENTGDIPPPTFDLFKQ
ncbi:hypothetical protein K2X92_04465 [Candidatus Gracilibacteria bacterium]|nr:hypothetical protein [Candidatus Gracilibacteria bacterium]